MDIDSRNVLMVAVGDHVFERGQNENGVAGVWVRNGIGGPGIFIRDDELVQVAELLAAFGDE